MSAVHTWSLPVAAPPSPPEDAHTVLQRAGLVDPLLQAVLPAALRGDRAPQVGPQGGWWMVSVRHGGERLVVVATEVTDWVAAQRALELAAKISAASGIEAALRHLPAEVRLVGAGWALDRSGPLRLDGLETQAATQALGGRPYWSDERWGAVPLSVEGEVFAALVAPCDDRGERALLEAWSVALAAPLARLLAVNTSLLEGLSHSLRTPLHAILGYVGLLEEELADNQGARFDLARIRAAAREELQLVEHLLARVRIDEAPEGVVVSSFTAEALLGDVAATLRPLLQGLGVDLVITPCEAELETDLQRLSAVLVALVRGRLQRGSPQTLKAHVEGNDLVLELRGGTSGRRSARVLAHALLVGLQGALDDQPDAATVRVPRYLAS